MNSDDNPVHDAVILLVDDDPGDQELTRRALMEDVIKIDLRVVNDGEEAMDYLKRRGQYQDRATSPRPDLILLDLNMPKMDGKQVLKEMHKDPSLSELPVVVLTTSKQDQDILCSYKLGCNSFITKPVDIGKFIVAIRQLGEYWFRLVALPGKVA